MYQFAWVGPVDLQPGVKLHQRRAVQCEGLPRYQLHRVHRKQLDIVNLTSCWGGRDKAGRHWEAGTDGGHSDIVSAFSFLTGPEEMTFLWSREAILL